MTWVAGCGCRQRFVTAWLIRSHLAAAREERVQVFAETERRATCDPSVAIFADRCAGYFRAGVWKKRRAFLNPRRTARTIRAVILFARESRSIHG